MGYGVVSELLNSVSKQESEMVDRLETIMILRNQIEKNPMNCQSVNGIEELAQDIRMAGLEQPLVVYQKEDGNYRLLTGERRLTAIDLLIEKGELPPSEECYLPCIVKDLDEYKLPLSDELKEKYAIRRTNRFNRNPTDADIMRDYQDWKEIISALKKQGYDQFVVGQDENGEDIVQSLKGRTREIAQKTMGTQVSTGQLAKYDKVEKKAIPEVVAAVEQERLNIAVAEKVSQMEANKQAEFIESTKDIEKIMKQDYDAFVKQSGINEGYKQKENIDVKESAPVVLEDIRPDQEANAIMSEEFDVEFILQVRSEYIGKIGKKSDIDSASEDMKKNEVIVVALDLLLKKLSKTNR